MTKKEYRAEFVVGPSQYRVNLKLSLLVITHVGLGTHFPTQTNII